jgi:hypothetical protein
MRPADILALQAELGSRLDDHRFSNMFDSYFVDTIASGRPAQDSSVPEHGYASKARAYLKLADAYRVESHMNRMIATHAHAFADDDTALGYEPPSESGFVVFEEPLALKEISGLEQYIHMLAWCPLTIGTELAGTHQASRGLLFYAFNDIFREADPVFVRNRTYEAKAPDYDIGYIDSIIGRFSLIFTLPCAFAWPMGESIVYPTDVTVSAQRYADMGMTADAGADNVRRYFTALCGLLSEVLPGAQREPAELDRRARKIAARQKIKPQVDLVTLRRIDENRNATGTGTPWSVRAIVVRHPRTYHRGTEREYTIWIEEHEAGPKDAPYSMRRKVRNLKR